MNIAVVVNLNARKGSQRFAARARRVLPRSHVVATRSMDDLHRFLDESEQRGAPGLVLSAGGDGTAIGLLDAMRARGIAFPAVGLVPLGTGNAWAIGTQSPSPHGILERISQHTAFGGTHIPTNDFALIEVEGRVTPFAGSGWDAELLHDYKQQRLATPERFRRFVEGPGGYAMSLFGRTIPRNVRAQTRPQVRVTNLGAPALGLDASGKVIELPNGGTGAVLYEGPYGVAGAGTSRELGFGFKAFNFARALPGRMHVRVYAATAGEATLRLPNLWRGVHPMPHSHDFLMTACRMEFDREVPVEVGGDVIGLRTSVEYRVSAQVVPLVDWSKLLRQ